MVSDSERKIWAALSDEPAPGAERAERSAWLDRLAVVLDEVAADDPYRAERATRAAESARFAAESYRGERR